MKLSLSALLCAVGLLFYVVTAPSSKADSRPYCIAYARDLANRKIIPPPPLEPTIVNPTGDLITATASAPETSEDQAKMERLWRRAYKSALQSCLEQYSTEQPKTVPVAPKPPAPAKPIAKKVEKVEKQANAAADGPKRGSEEWKKSCLAKHPSFNAETGTYRTWSGAQRECRL